MTESTYGLAEKTPSQGSVRAKYYRDGVGYTVLTVKDGKHRFYWTAGRESAEELVRLLER